MLITIQQLPFIRVFINIFTSAHWTSWHEGMLAAPSSRAVFTSGSHDRIDFFLLGNETFSVSMSAESFLEEDTKMATGKLMPGSCGPHSELFWMCFAAIPWEVSVRLFQYLFCILSWHQITLLLTIRTQKLWNNLCISETTNYLGRYSNLL